MVILVVVLSDDEAYPRAKRGVVVETKGEEVRPGIRKAVPADAPLTPRLQRLSRWIAGERP